MSGPIGKPPGSLWTLKHGQMAQQVPAGHDHSSASPASSLLMEAEVTLAGHTHEKAEGLLRAHSRASQQLLGPGNLHADDSRSFAQGTRLPKVPPRGRTGRHPPAVLRALWGQPLPHPGLLRCRLPRAGRREASAAPGGQGGLTARPAGLGIGPYWHVHVVTPFGKICRTRTFLTVK